MDQRGLKLCGAVLAASLLAAPAHAGLQNDVPSCYAANRITPANGTGYSRLIYLLIDQTVGWTPAIERAIFENLDANLLPGTKFVIAEFSAFGQGRYLDVIHTGVIEAPMPAKQADNTPIMKDRIFDACLRDQRLFAETLANRSLQSALQGSTSSLNHSDILSALQAVSAVIAADPAPRKLLLLASDGLENSSVMSFYAHGHPRRINPRLEIGRVAADGLFGNFGGARVFVIGGALQGSGSSGAAYRSPPLLQSLKQFWQLYFEKSNARLQEFGEPALLRPVGFQK